MKKTLLSIITMAILASGSAYAAQSAQKNIAVEAEITKSLIITMDKADGSPFNSFELKYESSGDQALGYSSPLLIGTQRIKITAPQGTAVRISLTEELVMHHEKKAGKKLFPSVHLGDRVLSGGNANIILAHKYTYSGKQHGAYLRDADVYLLVFVENADTIPAGKYTGVLKLVMESVP